MNPLKHLNGLYLAQMYISSGYMTVNLRILLKFSGALKFLQGTVVFDMRSPKINKISNPLKHLNGLYLAHMYISTGCVRVYLFILMKFSEAFKFLQGTVAFHMRTPKINKISHRISTPM